MNSTQKPAPLVNDKALSALFAQTKTPMLLVDDERRYRAANDAACALLGRSQQELCRLRIEDLVAGAGSENVEALWQEFLRDGSQGGEIELARADGSPVTVSYSATADIAPGLHLSVFPGPGREDPVLDRISAASTDEPPAQLSGREREVLTLFALGATGPEIAERLFLSPETVRTHTRRARDKLAARSRSHAIALAVKTRQIDV